MRERGSTHTEIDDFTGEWSQDGDVESTSDVSDTTQQRNGTASNASIVDWLKSGEEPLPKITHKAPFTDSGYASVPYPNHTSHVPSALEQSQVPADSEPSTALDDKDREDVRTVYSAATTVGPAHAQNYISELCSDIYNRLGSCLDPNLRKTLPGALPWLVKAFAIKIGYDSPTQVNQDIMYFIHKRHE
jgi:hypothetical protein